MLLDEELSGRLLALAIEVHRDGAGLLESAYQNFLAQYEVFDHEVHPVAAVQSRALVDPGSGTFLANAIPAA